MKGDGDCKIFKITQEYCLTGPVGQGVGMASLAVELRQCNLKVWLGSNTSDSLRVLVALCALQAAQSQACWVLVEIVI